MQISLSRRPAAAVLAWAATIASAPVAAETAKPAQPNRLAGESSPYLLLHAENPVDWYPWGEEALARARQEDKPIFLSVGYSTCYWCHVMEREVFSDPEIAAQMNRWFVNVKVDREERPDLDEIYMTATQLLTGRGGWPNSVFLTPELEPFFAGTYFPPEDAPNRPGFPRVLDSVRRSWQDDRSTVKEFAARVVAGLERALSGDDASAPLPRGAAERAAADLLDSLDEEWGGFGDGPKFPSVGSLALLWDRAEAGDARARAAVVRSLEQMGRGAIYDHLGGGFHRYTLDAAWRVPHFEKMLYDNALLADLLARVAAATGNAELERRARDTLDFLLGPMALPEGGLRSAIDAETRGLEGAYYLWTDEELRETLSPEDLELLTPIFGLDRPPAFEEGRRALYLTDSLDRHATRLDLSLGELAARLAPPLDRLRAVRERREHPRVDDKVLTDWNALSVAALAIGADRLGEPRYLAAARRTADFLLRLRDAEGKLLHVWRNGEARIPAFLDDYAFLVRALLILERVTGERRWLAEAERLTGELERRLGIPGGAYYAAGEGGELLLRPVTAQEGAVPSGNGVMALNLLALAERTGRSAYRRRAAEVVGAFRSALDERPAALATVARAAGRYPVDDARPASARPRGLPRGEEVVELRGRFAGDPSPRGWQSFELAIEILPGWHLNANPASLESLLPTRLDGAVRGVDYPAGEVFAPAFADQPLAVYSGSLALTGEARPGDPLTLVYQACDDRRCLPPVRLPVHLDGGGDD